MPVKGICEGGCGGGGGDSVRGNKISPGLGTSRSLDVQDVTLILFVVCVLICWAAWIQYQHQIQSQ